MADLLEERTETSPPFTFSGMDRFGPFIVKEGRKELKRYGLLFTCLCSRAVHTETLGDLTTEAFMNALWVFIAIRGPVRQLRCDQGTNFMAARREFSELIKGMDLGTSASNQLWIYIECSLSESHGRSLGAPDSNDPKYPDRHARQVSK